MKIKPSLTADFDQKNHLLQSSKLDLKVEDIKVSLRRLSHIKILTYLQNPHINLRSWIPLS